MEKHKNLPSLRFPEFTGVWEKNKLRDLTTLITKGTTPSNFTESGIKFIKIECLLGANIITEKCLFVDEKTHKRELKRSILSEGDILFAIAGATIGKCSIVTKEILPANTNQALSLIRLKTDENRLFIYHCLKSNKMQKYIIDTISVGAQPNLNLEQMGNFSFSLPSPPEQTKISTFLTAVDERLNQLKQKKTLLEQYKKGVMQKIFDQEIRFMDDEGNKFPVVVVNTLGYLAKITTGKLDANAMIENGKYRFYTCAKSFYRIDNYAFNTEALLISGNGANVGYIHYYKGKFNAYQRTYVLDGFKENIIYVKYHLEQFLSTRIDIEKKEGNTPYIVLSTLSDMEINLPCLEEQTKIANFLSAIDDNIILCDNQIAKTEQYKKGLLQQMFV